MLTPNATIDRLRFISKQYAGKKPWIVMSMVKIVAATVGADRWWNDLDVHSDDRDDEFIRQIRRWGREPVLPIREQQIPSAFVEKLVGATAALPQFVLSNRADPIFAWMAAQLAQVGDNDDYGFLEDEFKKRGTMLSLWASTTRAKLADYTAPKAVAEAERWFDEEGPIPQGEVVKKLSKGWTAQHLTKEDELDREGERMQHCVGSYYAEVSHGGTDIFSLRDANGNPHVTYEVKNNRIKQIKGKQNAVPAEKYQPFVKEFTAWLETESGLVNRLPARLQAYVDILNKQSDIEEEHVEAYAHDWAEVTDDAVEMGAWLDAGVQYSEIELVSGLKGENVTPDECNKFPHAIIAKMTSQGGYPREGDDLVEVARMAIVLQELAPKRDLEKPTKQIDMFDKGDSTKRVPGQEPAAHATNGGRSTYYHSWFIPSIDHDRWDAHTEDLKKHSVRVGGEWVKKEDEWDVDEWLYPAEEWIQESFKSSGDSDAYVGPWFTARFTPEQATEWWDVGIEDGQIAAELRDRRVTPQMIEKSGIKDNAKLSRMSADQIIDFIDDTGMTRNRRISKRRTSKRKQPARRRTSKRRSSKRRSSKRKA